MMTFKRLQYLAAVSLMGSTAMAGQAEVDAVIGSMPAANAEVATAKSAALLKEGAAAAVKLLQNYKPFTGQKKNIQVEYALVDLSHYLASPAVSAEVRGAYEQAYLKFLTTSAALETKAFALRQLRFIASPAGIKPLAAYINQAQLSDPALRALLTVAVARDKHAEVAAVVRPALSSAKGANRIEILKALGSLRDKQSLPAFEKAVSDSDAAIRELAVRALSNTADKSSKAAFEKALGKAEGVEQRKFLVLYLQYAERLGEQGLKSEAAAICRSIFKRFDKPEHGHLQCGALYSLAAVDGAGATPDLLGALENRSSYVRAAAGKILGRNKSTAAGLVTVYGKSSDIKKESILKILAQQGSPEGEALAIEALSSSNKALSQAGIDALSYVGGVNAAKTLLKAMTSADQADAAATVLKRIKGDIAGDIASACTASSDSAYKIKCLEILSEREEKSQFSVAVAAAQSEDKKVRKAGSKALKALASEKDI